MFHMNPGIQPKRRPVTYGKTSRKVALEFHEPHKSSKQNRDGTETVQETIVGRIRKIPTLPVTMNTSPASSNSSIGANLDEATSPSQSSISRTTHQPPDPFDVPSSDEDRPTIRANPVAKKRKIHGKPSPDRIEKPGPKTSALQTNTGSDSMNGRLLPAAKIHKRGPKVYASRISPELSICGEALPISYPQRERPVSGNRTAASNSGTIDSNLQINNHRAQHVYTNLKRPQRGKDPPRIRGTKSISPKPLITRNRPNESVEQSTKLPQTPPQTSGRNQRQGVSLNNYFSPSGLDIPRLSISSHPPTSMNTSRGSPIQSNATDSMAASRPKVKDRLATRDGVSRPYVAFPDSTSSQDEEECFVYGTEASVKNSQLNAQNCQEECSMDRGRAKSLYPSNEGCQSLASQRPNVTVAGPRVTYTARERSLRKEEGDDMILSLTLEEERPQQKQPRRLDFRNTTHVSQQLEDIENSEEEPLPGAPVRTIHELRQAGGNARIFSQIEATLDDVTSTMTSLKRNGILDLQEKLQNLDFRSQFISSGLASRLLPVMHPSLDLLTKTLLSATILQLVAHDTASQTISKFAAPSVLQSFDDLISRTSSLAAIAKIRSFNVPKATQQDIQKLVKDLLTSSVWRQGRPNRITPRLLSLQILEYMVRNVRKAGIFAGLGERGLLNQLLDALISIMSSVETSAPADGIVDIKLILSILESITLYPQSSETLIEGFWSTDSIGKVAEFLLNMRKLNPDDAGRVWSLTLRLCLNLISRSATACSIFGKPLIVDTILELIVHNFHSMDSETSVGQQSIMADDLVLSLGFLITLAERDSQHREVFTTKNKGSRTPLDILMGLFNSRWQQAFEVVSEDELRKNVPLGFLASLLSYLSIDLGTRSYIASGLEGGNLKHLLIAVGEFLKIYKKTEEIRATQDDIDLTASFVGKLQTVINMLKDDMIRGEE